MRLSHPLLLADLREADECMGKNESLPESAWCAFIARQTNIRTYEVCEVTARGDEPGLYAATSAVIVDGRWVGRRLNYFPVSHLMNPKNRWFQALGKEGMRAAISLLDPEEGWMESFVQMCGPGVVTEQGQRQLRGIGHIGRDIPAVKLGEEKPALRLLMPQEEMVGSFLGGDA